MTIMSNSGRVIRGVAATAIAGAAFFAFASAASAVPCTTYVEDSVTGYVANTCEVGGANNDSAGQLDTDMIGGYTGWVEIDKLDPPDPGTEGALTIGGTGERTYTTDGTDLLGEWEIAASAYDTYGVIALVFKAGGGNIDPDEYVVYLTNSENLSGTFRSPFVNGTNGNPTDISHFTIYGIETEDCLPVDPVCRPGQTPIPLPAALPLFLSGMGAMGIIGWRRRRKHEAG